MASRPHIGLAFKRMHEARALNAYLIAQLDRSRAGTDVKLDTCVTLKEGGQGTRTNSAGGRAERVPSENNPLTDHERYAKLVRRARQSAKRFKGNR